MTDKKKDRLTEGFVPQMAPKKNERGYTPPSPPKKPITQPPKKKK